MQLRVRPATADDVPALVGLYERAYRGGYSACFDRYGPVGPQEFWWVQSEKDLRMIEVNRAAAGLLITSRAPEHLLVEEVIVEGADEAIVRRVAQHLARQARDERHPALLLRAHEGNPAALALARAEAFAFVNALVVAAHPATAPPAAAPDGYAVRRATPDDAPALAQLYADAAGAPQPAGDVAAALRRVGVRAFVAERERFPVGFVVAEAREGGVGTWALGVREAHRRRGLGTLLAAEAFQFFRRRRLRAVVTYWGVDGPPAAFTRALGFATERTYLYFEKAI